MSKPHAIDQEAIERANERVAELVDGFCDWATAELLAAKAVLSTAVETNGADPEETEKVFHIFHNLKGQGGTFDFPLVTQISAAGCDLVREHRSASIEQVHFLKAACDVMETVLQNRFTGDGGDQGRALLQRLQVMAKDAGG